MKTDDPRLTAYALGELPATERDEIESALGRDAALAAELEATRSFADRLRGELRADEGSALSEQHREKVFAARKPAVVAMPAPKRRLGVYLLRIAAVLVLAAVVAGLMFPAIGLQKASSKRAVRHEDSEVGRMVSSAKVSGPAPVEQSPSSRSEMPNFAQLALPAAENQRIDKALEDAKARGEKEISMAAAPEAPAVPGLEPVESRVFAGAELKLERQQEIATAPPVPAPLARSRTMKPTAFHPGLNSAGREKLAANAPSDPEPIAGVAEREGAFRRHGDEVRKAKEQGNTEAYDSITDNAFLPVKDNPLSTLSIDVDTASYANVRRFLTSGALPPKGAVRIEEMLNYFTYDYPQPAGDAPFSATMEVAACPWTPAHRLVRIGLKGKDVARSERPAANLVFLIDVSGSMRPANKLPLVKQSLRLLIDQLDDRDLVAIAVYAGASGTVLEPTRDKTAMRAALDRLEAGGSTNGGGGIRLAYDLATQSFLKGGTNRVILATDGDFNVGITNQSDLAELITEKAKSGVFLSVLGFGMGNLKDSTLEKLADKGNGNYGYIDTLAEAKKTLVEQMNGTLHTIAKDVKIQVEFNPAQASAYRLIGYENRLLAKEDFNDDKKDAGEIGAGHSVTALYEVVPAGQALPGVVPGVDALKYTTKLEPAPAPERFAIRNPQLEISPELLTLKLRYKMPDGDVSSKVEFPLTDRGETWEKSSQDFRWAASVASFGMLLRDSPHKGGVTWDSTLELAHEGKGDDRAGYRAECIELIEKARTLTR